MEHLWAPWRMAYVGGEEPETDGCFLCTAAAEGLANSLVVERADATVTLLNRFPYNSGHVMIAPARHEPDIRGLDTREGNAVFTAMQRAMFALDRAFAPGGFNIGVNQGSAAGASIEHVHVHVVPRWGGDTNFMPVVADVKVLPEHLDATAAKLRAAYATLERERGPAG